MARVHNGVAFEEVVGGAGNTAAQSPVPPVADGDGSIFISIPTFRGTTRIPTFVSHALLLQVMDIMDVHQIPLYLTFILLTF